MNRERPSWRLIFSALAAALMCGGCKPSESPDPAAPTQREVAYVASATCRTCHATEFEHWSGSHHDRAMQRATAENVLGDFDRAGFEHFGTSWEFFRKADRFWVRTEGVDGQRADFEILYTFGIEPLQQYLVALPNGGLQALTVAWDSRPPEAGGQRWFTLHPDGPTPPGDVLHWTGVANRWDSMCADCHSTNLQKHFDPDAKRYETSWSEIDVACEACHGPGSDHVAWAEQGTDPSRPNGLRVNLSGNRDVQWVMQPDVGIARREPARTKHQELEVCAPCHARRSRIHNSGHGGDFLDSYRPSLLEEGLYFADGQIQDEVYVYGSFLQSKMYRAGVSCGDCHDSHSLELRASGDALCSTCHAPQRFAVPTHHNHPQDSPGARCVSCHMPERTYMVVDNRRDHSFRIPRPDLSVELGTPHACQGCHADRGANWAADAVRAWFPDSAERASYAHTLDAGRRGRVDAPRALRDLARLASAPGIARATAVALLGRYPSPDTAEAITAAAKDPDPLVRSAAAEAAGALPPSERARAVASLLEDPKRSVRIEAARALAPVKSLDSEGQKAKRAALSEYRRSQEMHADLPSAHVNLGLLALSQGEVAKAEAAYKKAIDVGAYFIPAYVNLADLYARQQRSSDSERLLRQAVAIAPDSPEVHHALGLSLVRQQRHDEALSSLARASELAPDSARYAYVYGVALNSFGESERALSVLDAALLRHPNDRDLLEALFAIARDSGLRERSARYGEQLKALPK